MTPVQPFNPLRSLGSSWRILMKAPLPMWGGGLLLLVVQSAGGLGGNYNLDRHSGREMLWILLPMMGFGLIMGLVMMLAASWLAVGYYRSIREVMRSGQAEFEDVLKPHGLWLQMFLTRLVLGLLSFVALLPLGVPPTVGLMLHAGLGLDKGAAVAIGVLGALAYLPVYVYIVLGLMFMPYATALEGLSVGPAIGRSWEIARGQRWWLVLFGIGSMVTLFVGLMVCVVGVFPAAILVEVMWCEAYIQATDIVGDSREWWIEGRASGADRSRGESDSGGGVGSGVGRTGSIPPPSDEPFDPGRWRGEADIPPIEE